MNKYKVEFIQKETFIVDVKAKDVKEAISKANEKWEEGDYKETGDLSVEVNNVYDVSDTDDPFNEPCQLLDGDIDVCDNLNCNHELLK